MKWLIASDLHGSAYYCRALLDAFDREGADRLLLLGDLLYHGPRNDLPREYDPKAVGGTATRISTKLCSNSPSGRTTPCWPKGSG